MSPRDKNPASINCQQSIKSTATTPPVFMQQDPTTNALTYIHYDQQPYKEVDIYQAYHNKYTTENDPLHTSEQDDDEESLPSLLEPGENEDTGFSDDEESVSNDIPILLERDDESDSDNEDELEIPTAVYDIPQKGIQPTVIRNQKRNPAADHDHEVFGDDITQKAPNTCRIYFQNVAGVSPADDWSNLTDNFLQMKKKEVDIFGFAETNVAWTPKAQNESRRHGRGIFEHYTQVTASSDEPTVGYRQPGGTLMATRGNLSDA